MGDAPISWNLLTVVRIIHASAKEINEHSHLKVFDDEMISMWNELEVCNFFISIADNLLRTYKTTLV
jgi:hypothetical protein